jgi:hypothetical protein
VRRYPQFQCNGSVIEPPLAMSPKLSYCQRTLCSASSSSSVPPHGDSLLVLEDISEVGERALELPAVDGLGSLAGVLEGNA